MRNPGIGKHRDLRNSKPLKPLPVAYLWDLVFCILRTPGAALIFIYHQGSLLPGARTEYKTYHKAREAIRHLIKDLKDPSNYEKVETPNGQTD